MIKLLITNPLETLGQLSRQMLFGCWRFGQTGWPKQENMEAENSARVMVNIQNVLRTMDLGKAILSTLAQKGEDEVGYGSLFP